MAVNLSVIVALLERGRVDLVVDVGDVARVEHVRIRAAQQRRQHVENDGPARVADVHVAVDGGAAQVHGDPVRVLRLEGFQAAVAGVVEGQFHARILPRLVPR
jgi:hypothetical protein